MVVAASVCSAPMALAEGFGTPVVDGVLDGIYGAAEASDPSDDPQGNAPMDLLDLHVINDNDFWYFHFTIDDDVSANNWGKYLLYIDTTSDGSGATFDAWGRNVVAVVPHLPEFSLNSWLDGGGTYSAAKTQLHSWNGAAWSQIGSASEAALGAGTVSGIEWKVAKSDLGNPSSIWVEVYSTSGGGGDNAQDTINDPSDDWNASDWTTQSVLFCSTRVDEQAGSDNTPPVMTNATTVGEDPITEVLVSFSEAVSSVTAENTSNYTIGFPTPGVGISSAVLQGDGSSVLLTLDQALDYGVGISVEANGINDLSGNTIVDNNTTNVDCFKVFDLLIRARMNLYLRTNSAGQDTVSLEGSLSPLTWDPTCDDLMTDVDADSVYEARKQFTIDADCADGTIPPGSSLEYKFNHQCVTWESTENHFYEFSDAVGVDTLDIWWQDEAPQDFTANPVDLVFMVSMNELETPPLAMDSVSVSGSELPFTWDLPKINLADDGVAPDESAGDGVYSGRFTFPAGTFKFLQYKFAINSDFECSGLGNREVAIDDVNFDSAGNPQIIGLEYYDNCRPVSSVPTGISATSLQLAVSPNPLSAKAQIRFVAKASESGTVEVFDISGRKVRTLASEVFEAGAHNIAFDGRDAEGRSLSPGLYLVRVVLGSESQALPMTVLR